MLPPGRPHRHGRKRPPQLLRGPPSPDNLRPQPEPPALRAVPGAFLPPAPPTPQRPGVVPRLHRPGTVPTPRGRPAVRTRQPRHIPPPRHLHQHRPLPQRVPHHLPGERRQPGRPRGLVPGEIPVPHGPHERRRPPDLLPRGDQRPGPPALHELRGLHRAAPTAQQKRALVLRGPQQQHIPGMRLRSMRLTVAVVPVVPDDDKTEIPHRREHRGPCPHHGPNRPPPHREPLPVPLLGPGVGGQHRMPPGPHQLRQRGVDPGDGPPVRHHDQRPPPGRKRRRDSPSDLRTPLRPGQGVPHGPRCPTRGQRPQKRTPALVPRPGPRLRHTGHRQRLRRIPLLGPSATRRHRKLQHIGKAPGVPIRDSPSQPQQLLIEYPLGRHHLSQRRQRPRVIGLRQPLDEKPVDQPPALTTPFPHPMPPGPEPHPNPHPGLSIGIQLRRHRIVEVPVKMQHPLVHEHPSNRQLRRQLRPPPGARLRPRPLGLPHTLPNERKLLRRRPLSPTTTLPVFPAHPCILTKPH